MGFFGSKKGSIISDFFKLLEDVGQMKANNMVEVALYDDHLELSAPMSKQPISLNYKQITDVYYGIETQIKDKAKSPIARAVVGGMLFGSSGAIVGATSGIGTKQTKEYKHLFVISYTSSAGQDAFLQFEDSRKYKGGKLAKKLKDLCEIEDTIISAL